jgi:hypothetical protein
MRRQIGSPGLHALIAVPLSISPTAGLSRFWNSQSNFSGTQSFCEMLSLLFLIPGIMEFEKLDTLNYFCTGHLFCAIDTGSSIDLASNVNCEAWFRSGTVGAQS